MGGASARLRASTTRYGHDAAVRAVSFVPRDTHHPHLRHSFDGYRVIRSRQAEIGHAPPILRINALPSIRCDAARLDRRRPLLHLARDELGQIVRRTALRWRDIEAEVIEAL